MKKADVYAYFHKLCFFFNSPFNVIDKYVRKCIKDRFTSFCEFFAYYFLKAFLYCIFADTIGFLTFCKKSHFIRKNIHRSQFESHQVSNTTKSPSAWGEGSIIIEGDKKEGGEDTIV